jgi:uncharacterized damage-inducible protein DinB
MITPDYCQTMARYNMWQNAQLNDAMSTMDHDALTRPRGAFFGSILGTANHLAWGDAMWMSRFAGTPAPELPLPRSAEAFPTRAAWWAERLRLDRRIRHWADGLRRLDLLGELRWYSSAKGAEVTAPTGRLIVHMFNHQTHHRGQIHAMLTAAGQAAPVSDLFLMPDEEG